MQAAMVVASNVNAGGLLGASHTSLLRSTAIPMNQVISLPICRPRGGIRMRPVIVQSQPQEQEYVNYTGKQSVFPAEACEDVGGDACVVEGVGPEVKPKAAVAKEAPKAAEGPDREYVDYVTEKKTVFPGEACDELGGEFCEEDFQKGVFPDKTKVSN